MAAQNRLAVLLMPRSELGEALESYASDWVGEGILSDFIWVRADNFALDGLRKLQLKCCLASSLGSENEFDLFQYLSEVVVDQVDVVVPWIVGDAQPDDELLDFASTLRAALKEGMPNGGSGASVRAKWLYMSLLVMPTTNRAIEGFESTSHNYGEFDLNVYVSPESRSNPWAGSAPLHQGSDFELFALAQIASIAGVWAGSTESLTALLERKSFRFGQDAFVMMRTMSSMVVTKGLADRLVGESLHRLASTTISPYEISDPNDLERPALVADEAQLIKEQIGRRISVILQVAGEEFTYVSEPKPDELDFSRDWKEAIRFFWQFTRDSVKAMPSYTVDFLKNERSRLVGRQLHNVREAVPERFLGVTLELKQMLDDIQSFRNDNEKQDTLAFSSVAYRKNPKVWAALRAVAFGSLDGSDTETGEKPIVLPRVDYVVHDPSARFSVPEEFREKFNLESNEIALAQADELRAVVEADLRATRERMGLIQTEIAAIELQLSDPYLDMAYIQPGTGEDDEELEDEELENEELENEELDDEELDDEEDSSEPDLEDEPVADESQEVEDIDEAVDEEVDEGLDSQGEEGEEAEEPAKTEEPQQGEEPAQTQEEPKPTTPKLVWPDEFSSPTPPANANPYAPKPPSKGLFQKLGRKPRKAAEDE